jgi:hypothetical protein
MDPTFEGCPVFVQHVDEVTSDMSKLQAEADGWVIESFFNKADGKHWCKFLLTSERAMDAVDKGYRLSNSYSADKLGGGGIWNDVTYDAEVLEGNFEHLALVPVPRYNESIILTPEKFKQYCAERELEVQRIANQGSKTKMALTLFKRTKVENGLDLENTIVVLPKSKKERTIAQIVNDADAHEMQHGMAHPDHMVDMGEGKKMAVKDLLNAYNDLAAKAKVAENDDDKEDVKEAHKDDPDATSPDDAEIEREGAKKDKKRTEVMGVRADSDDDKDNDSDSDDDSMQNEEDLAMKKVSPERELPKGEKPHNKSDAKRASDKVKADALRNAGAHNPPEVAVVNFSVDMVARGKSKYGSGR